jgi:tRNA G26 N,N-dimethylase Trm1
MNASKLIRDNMRTDAPGAAAERIAYREDAERAVREREAKFGAVTVDNFQSASDWQAARIQELQAARREGSK